MPTSLGIKMQWQGISCSTWLLLQAVSQGLFRGLPFSPCTWNHYPAALQKFLEDMLDMLDDLGLKVPPPGLPPIIWHKRAYFPGKCADFPGEILVNAMHAGASFFRAKPDIIFVCLPEKGRAAPMCLRATLPLFWSTFKLGLARNSSRQVQHTIRWGLWPGCTELMSCNTVAVSHARQMLASQESLKAHIWMPSRDGSVQGGQARQRLPHRRPLPVLCDAQRQHRHRRDARPQAVPGQPGQPALTSLAWLSLMPGHLSPLGSLLPGHLAHVTDFCLKHDSCLLSLTQQLSHHLSRLRQGRLCQKSCQDARLSSFRVLQLKMLVLQAMKINSKLGGVNWAFSKPLFPWMAKPFIVFGASVSHSGACRHPP